MINISNKEFNLLLNNISTKTFDILQEHIRIPKAGSVGDINEMIINIVIDEISKIRGSGEDVKIS